MRDRIEKIKSHIERYRVTYSCVVTGVIAAGITCIIMRERHATLLSRVDGPETADTSVTVRSLSFFANQKNDIVTTIHNGMRGHPGFIIRNIETDQYFATQADAARAFDINPSNLSQHLNGKYPDANGHQFERVQVA